MYDNNIGAEGLKHLSEALKVNTVLTTLYLYGNNIGDETLKRIEERVRINKVNKTKLIGLQFLCANKIKEIGKDIEVKAILSPLVYEHCFKL